MKYCLNCKKDLSEGKHPRCRWEHQAKTRTFQKWLSYVRENSKDFNKNVLKQAQFVSSLGSCNSEHYVTRVHYQGDSFYNNLVCERSCNKCYGPYILIKRFLKLKEQEEIQGKKNEAKVKEIQGLIKAIRDVWPEIKDDIMGLIHEFKKEEGFQNGIDERS